MVKHFRLLFFISSLFCIVHARAQVDLNLTHSFHAPAPATQGVLDQSFLPKAANCDEAIEEYKRIGAFLFRAEIPVINVFSFNLFDEIKFSLYPENTRKIYSNVIDLIEGDLDELFSNRFLDLTNKNHVTELSKFIRESIDYSLAPHKAPKPIPSDALKSVFANDLEKLELWRYKLFEANDINRSAAEIFQYSIYENLHPKIWKHLPQQNIDRFKAFLLAVQPASADELLNTTPQKAIAIKKNIEYSAHSMLIPEKIPIPDSVAETKLDEKKKLDINLSEVLFGHVKQENLPHFRDTTQQFTSIYQNQVIGGIKQIPPNMPMQKQYTTILEFLKDRSKVLEYIQDLEIQVTLKAKTEKMSHEDVMMSILKDYEAKHSFGEARDLENKSYAWDDWQTMLAEGRPFNDINFKDKNRKGNSHGALTHRLQWLLVMKDMEKRPELYKDEKGSPILASTLFKTLGDTKVMQALDWSSTGVNPADKPDLWFYIFDEYESTGKTFTSPEYFRNKHDFFPLIGDWF